MIKRGQEWARTADGPYGQIVTSDGELASAIGREVVLRGGDVHRALGAPSGEASDRVVEVDLLEIRADGSLVCRAASHILIGRPPRRMGRLMGEWAIVSNAGFVGPFDIAPGAHPGDGRMDVVRVSASMSRRQRLGALRRSRLGAHLPHPDLSITRTTTYEVSLIGHVALWADGRRVQINGESASIAVVPGAVTVRL